MKKSYLFSVLFIVLFSLAAHAQDGEIVNQTTIIREGVSLGAVIAVVCSWSRNESILWAILHGIFSWFYVIYFAITRK